MARIEAEATVFIACMEAEDWDNAHKAVKKLYRLDKTNRTLHYTTIGYVSEMKNEIKKALKIYKRAISRYNNSEWAYFNMGYIYFSQAVEIIVNTDQMPLPHEQYIIERAKADEYFRQAMPQHKKGYQINRNMDFLDALRVVYYKLGMMKKFDEIEQLIEERKNERDEK
jgi:tetratricopeptide (TPR) repeat protein